MPRTARAFFIALPPTQLFSIPARGALSMRRPTTTQPSHDCLREARLTSRRNVLVQLKCCKKSQSPPASRWRNSSRGTPGDSRGHS